MSPELVRRQNPAASIVAGGPFADACPRDVLDTGVFDFVAHGEGETLLPRLVAAVKNGTDPGEIGGLSFFRDGAIVRTPSPPMIADLDALPFPAYDLLPMALYHRHSIMASRGCPWDCIFCDRGPTESRRVRFLSPERVRDWATRMTRRIRCQTLSHPRQHVHRQPAVGRAGLRSVSRTRRSNQLALPVADRLRQPAIAGEDARRGMHPDRRRNRQRRR